MRIIILLLKSNIQICGYSQDEGIVTPNHTKYLDLIFDLNAQF